MAFPSANMRRSVDGSRPAELVIGPDGAEFGQDESWIGKRIEISGTANLIHMGGSARIMKYTLTSLKLLE